MGRFSVDRTADRMMNWTLIAFIRRTSKRRMLLFPNSYQLHLGVDEIDLAEVR